MLLDSCAVLVADGYAKLKCSCLANSMLKISRAVPETPGTPFPTPLYIKDRLKAHPVKHVHIQ